MFTGMKSNPNELAFPEADQTVSASCRSCCADLVPDDRLCPRCGALVEGEWIACQINCWRGRLCGEFTAVYRGEAPWSIAARSERFRWVHGEEPPRKPAVEARLAELCRMLESDGWLREENGEPGSWYQLSFRSFVGPTAAAARPQSPEEPEVESTAAFAPITAELPLEPVKAAATEIPSATVGASSEPKHPGPPAPEPVSHQAGSGASESLQFAGAPAMPQGAEPSPDPFEIAVMRESSTVGPAANEELERALAVDPEPAPEPAQPEPAERVGSVPWHVTPHHPPSSAEELPVETKLLARIGAYSIKTEPRP
jgi:hypothetical protein